MCSLRAKCGHLGHFSLKPVSTLSQLTSLLLSGKVFQDDEDSFLEPLVQLGYLPASLKELDMVAVYADRETFASIHCPELTKLTFLCEQNSDSDIAELLRWLPPLKVQTFIMHGLFIWSCRAVLGASHTWGKVLSRCLHSYIQQADKCLQKLGNMS